MREMKPFILPQLVAARKSSRSSFETYDLSSSVHSLADSGFYSASECSTPPTPCFPSRGHFRYPSSTSSLSSSPPAHDSLEIPNASGKLPKLTEEPVEREEEYATPMPHRCSCDSGFCMHTQQSNEHPVYGQAPEFTDDYFDYEDSKLFKRRRSVASSANSITNRIESRFPSFSRKVRERNRPPTLSRPSRSATPSSVPSRTASTRIPTTRSSSMTSSIHNNQGFDLTDKFPLPTTEHNSRERLDDLPVALPIDVAKANEFDDEAEQQKDAERFATTPLLPPLLVNRQDDLPMESPLQSPTVADATHSLVATPIGTPPARSYPTPPLSSKPSVSSFYTSRPGYMVPSSDIPEILLSDPNDKWALKLSHANFTIKPEPYMPGVCDATSVRQLFADWEQARCNFTKHQVRTGEHYGVTSRTYLLTEQKWAEVDTEWKMNHDLAVSRATASGEEPEPTSPVEPAPLSKMPFLNDPKSEGKFPKMGDEDIVGPMVQIAAQIQKTPTRKRAFFKFFSDMRFPSSFLGRSSTAVRDR